MASSSRAGCTGTLALCESTIAAGLKTDSNTEMTDSAAEWNCSRERSAQRCQGEMQQRHCNYNLLEICRISAGLRLLGVAMNAAGRLNASSKKGGVFVR